MPRIERDHLSAVFAPLCRELDEAGQPAGAPDDTDETIERPPATTDDDPAPSEPVRPLEAWHPSWDGAPTRPVTNSLMDPLAGDALVDLLSA